MMKEPRTVLVVDDEEDIRDILETVLCGEGYRVIMASNGKEAMTVLQHERPHLIILDMNMPQMGGVAFYHDAVANRVDGHPKFPVLIFTGRGELKDVFKGFKVDGFMSKPFEIDRLLAEVERIMEAHHGRPAHDPPGGAKDFKVLLCEDLDNCFDAIAGPLTQEGFGVIRVKKIDNLPAEAKAVCPDLVFLKVSSPSLNGPEFLTGSRLQGLMWPKLVPVVAYLYGILGVEERTLNTILNTSGVHSLIASARPEMLLETARRFYAFKKRDERAA